jgi:signal transduction histidine kinase
MDRRAVAAFLVSFIVSCIFLLIVVTPIGAIFGMVSTFGLVRRLRSLATATTLFADGHYEQRVRVRGKDEVAQMEYQFNRMAEQLAVSMAKQKELAESNARLAERSRISRELHDAISQDLFSLRMLAGGLQTALPEDSPVYQQVVTLEQTSTNMIREMRALLLELRPSQLEQLGLVESLQELAKAYHTRLGITVTTHITPVQLSPRIEHTLLRIAQEAVANAARHANATMITLTLEPQPQDVSLTITDNGKGFDPNTLNVQHGLGLRLMQERVEELHGTFLLHSEPCQGTRLDVCLPREVQV